QNSWTLRGDRCIVASGRGVFYFAFDCTLVVGVPGASIRSWGPGSRDPARRENALRKTTARRSEAAHRRIHDRSVGITALRQRCRTSHFGKKSSGRKNDRTQSHQTNGAELAGRLSANFFFARRVEKKTQK